MPLAETARLPVGDTSFDIACMFSVITHQYPEDSRAIFTLLRRHSPDRNGGFCVYNPAYLGELVADAGWQLVASAPSEGPIIAHSFVYRPI